MAILSRKSGKPPDAKIPDFTDPTVGESKTLKPIDPARVATGVLLERALVAAGTNFEAAGRDGVIILVSVTGEPWTRLALAEWKTKVRGGREAHDGFRDRWYTEADWFSLSPTELERESSMKQAAENFAQAVAKGLHCAAFAADLSFLPPDLVVAADLHLHLPTLTGADVSLVARNVCNSKPSQSLSDAYAGQLTPRLLRLSRRPQQCADDYLAKLRDLLERDLASTVKVTAPSARKSVREAPTLDRLHGMAEAVAWAMAVKKDLQLFEDGEIPWSDVDSGALISSKPGCGKTLFARAMATTCSLHLVVGSYSQWYGTGSPHQGDLLKSMRKTFKEARDHAPSLLFIDEVDSFPNRATIDHYNAEWHIQVVNALLAEIDGVEGREGVVLLAACNFPEKLDPALIRSGRLSRHIHIGSPSRSSLAAIFREHLGNELEVENLSSAALAAAGSTGADVERFVAGARRRARDAGRAIILADLVAEIGGGDDRTATELWIAAIHESGHAVAYCELAPGTLQAITLRHSAESGGMTSASFSKAYISAADVRRQLVAMLAGRAAEDVILKIPSSACGGNATSDLAVATRLAAASATSLGLDHVSGLVWMGVPDTTTLPRMLSNSPALAARVHLIVDQAYQEAVTLIRRRSAAVKAVAAALLDRRGLDGGEVAAIVAQHPSRGMKAIHEPQS